MNVRSVMSPALTIVKDVLSQSNHVNEANLSAVTSSISLRAAVIMAIAI